MVLCGAFVQTIQGLTPSKINIPPSHGPEPFVREKSSRM